MDRHVAEATLDTGMLNLTKVVDTFTLLNFIYTFHN